ncbi:MAG: hypothetical protein ACLSUZ_05815 [Bifidobacterium pseudocatenulatum]
MSKPSRDSLLPLEDVGDCHDLAGIVESALDGHVGFAPCEGKARKSGGAVDGKVSLSWKRLNPSDESHVDASFITGQMVVMRSCRSATVSSSTVTSRPRMVALTVGSACRR